MLDTPDSCAAVCKDLNKLEKWTDRNLCVSAKVSANLVHQHMLGANWFQSNFSEKQLGKNQNEHIPATCPHSKGGQPHPGLYGEDYRQQAKGGTTLLQ